MNILPVLTLCSILNTGAKLDWLTEKSIYKEPMANPRSPEFGLTINTERYLGKRIGYLEGILGADFPIATFSYDNLKLQFGLQAAGWLDLGYRDGAFPMLTQDFYLGVPFSFRYKDFSGAIKFNHISSHLGDGMDIMLEDTLSKEEKEQYEFYDDIAEDEGMNLSLKGAEAYSRDFMSLHLSYEYTLGSLNTRAYFHAGYVHKMIPEELKRWFFGNGIELVYPLNNTAPYYAQDVTYNQDLDSVDYSSQLGLVMLPHKDTIFNIRFAITTFIGCDRRGQLTGRKLKRIGIGIFIR